MADAEERKPNRSGKKTYGMPYLKTKSMRRAIRMQKKCVSLCLVIAIVFTFTTAFATGAFSFADTFGQGQAPGSESGQAAGSFSFADAFEATPPPSSESGQAENPFSRINPFVGGQSPDSATNIPPEFVYRDGIKFGMTVDQVKQLEKNKPAQEQWEEGYGTANTYIVTYVKEKTLDFSCDINYVFTSKDGELIRIGVDVYTSILNDFDYTKLQNEYIEIDYALTQKYGEPDRPSSIEAVPGTSLVKQYTYWESNWNRNVEIQHSILSGGVNISHSINYYRVYSTSPGSI